MSGRTCSSPPWFAPRNRGPLIVPTIESVLDNDHPSFELVVVDQSTDHRTMDALEPFFGDDRLEIIRSDEVGLGRARNRGLQNARGAVIVYTDDDVTVPPNWLRVMDGIFRSHPDVAVAFCNVVAGPHDPRAGFIPTYERTDECIVTTVRGKNGARGIGAGLAVRRSMVQRLGGFDPLLGAGAEFSSCEDGDIALRALMNGMQVCETDRVEVVHHGFRSWEEGRALTRRDWYGIGAAYAKPIRCLRWSALIVVGYEGLWRATVVPLLPMLRGRRPSGIKRGWYFWRGFVSGLRTPTDRSFIVFKGPS